MINTKLDFDIYKAADDIQKRMEEIKNELYGNMTTSYNKEDVLDTLTGIIEEIQKVIYG